MLDQCHFGDVMTVLSDLLVSTVKVQMCVTSPPYWALRSYLPDDHPDKTHEIGLEDAPDLYIERLVEVFRLVRGLLKKDGVLWLNMGDCYAGSGVNDGSKNPGLSKAANRGEPAKRPGSQCPDSKNKRANLPLFGPNRSDFGLKPKDLVGIPWMLAFALRADGWWLRSDIVWNKPNPMPESVRDRPTRCHEYVFLLSKSRRYFYDADAIRTPYAESTLKEFEVPYDGQDTKDYTGAGVQSPSDIKRRIVQGGQPNSPQSIKSPHGQGFTMRAQRKYDDEQLSRPARGLNKRQARYEAMYDKNGANVRSVWTIATQPYAGAHFATFPEKLVERCILAGSKPGDTVLDPFFGSGTTGQVAEALGRHWIGIELNRDYEPLIKKRTEQMGLIP